MTAWGPSRAIPRRRLSLTEQSNRMLSTTCTVIFVMWMCMYPEQQSLMFICIFKLAGTLWGNEEKRFCNDVKNTIFLQWPQSKTLWCLQQVCGRLWPPLQMAEHLCGWKELPVSSSFWIYEPYRCCPHGVRLALWIHRFSCITFRYFFLALCSATIGVFLLFVVVLFVFIQHYLDPYSLRTAPQFAGE